MTIRLFDPSAQKRYEQELETYDLRSNERMKDPSISSKVPWPSYPKAPEPFADSKEAGLVPPRNGCVPMGGGYAGSAMDPRNIAREVDMDGNSQSAVEGYGVEDVSPFKTK
jgi:hypothetical protein